MSQPKDAEELYELKKERDKMRGKKGFESATNYNRRRHLVDTGQASWIPLQTGTIEEAWKRAGLPEPENSGVLSDVNWT